MFECVRHTRPIPFHLDFKGCDRWGIGPALRRGGRLHRTCWLCFLLLFYIILNLASAFIHSNLVAVCTTAISRGRKQFFWKQSKPRRRGRWRRDGVITRLRSGLGGRVCCEISSWRKRKRTFPGSGLISSISDESLQEVKVKWAFFWRNFSLTVIILLLINLLHLKEEFQAAANRSLFLLGMKETYFLSPFHHCGTRIHLICCGSRLCFTVLMFYNLYETINQSWSSRAPRRPCCWSYHLILRKHGPVSPHQLISSVAL